MAMPPLPEGFDWKVEFRVGKDTTDRSDHAKYTGFYWGDDRFLDQDKGLKAVIFLRQNGVILLTKEVNAHGLDTEEEFTAAIEAKAAEMFSAKDFNRTQWLQHDFS